jgi:hypothetical protein
VKSTFGNGQIKAEIMVIPVRLLSYNIDPIVVAFAGQIYVA